MPLTKKGQEIMGAMTKEYGAKQGKSVFYASRNKGKITGVDPASSGGGFMAPTPVPPKGKPAPFGGKQAPPFGSKGKPKGK